MTVAVVVVNWGHDSVLPALVDRLTSGSYVPDEIIVVDQADPPTVARKLGQSRATVMETRRNLGFPGACNAAAGGTSAELLFFLNPDTVPDHRCVEALVAALAADASAMIAGGQLLLPDGRTNAGANPVHPTGLSWAGGLYEPREYGPPRRVFAVSGGALMIRHRDFDRLGGFDERFFLYQEDTDLCWRARLVGGEVVFCPEATVQHDYVFEKPDKWYRLERNRLVMVLSNYEGRTLFLLAPLLVATEAAICVAALRGGWMGQKVRAYRTASGEFSWLRARRRRVRQLRRAGDAALWRLMAPTIESPMLASTLLDRARHPLRLYYRAVGRLLG